MSRHGVIMHCSYCREPDHNKGGCKYLKQGLPPPRGVPDVVEPEPVITQVTNQLVVVKVLPVIYLVNQPYHAPGTTITRVY